MLEVWREGGESCCGSTSQFRFFLMDFEVYVFVPGVFAVKGLSLDLVFGQGFVDEGSKLPWFCFGSICLNLREDLTLYAVWAGSLDPEKEF